MKVRGLFQPALAALRTYWPAFLAIQLAAAGLVVAYFLSPSVQSFCEIATGWKERGGMGFAALANVISGGLIPEAIKRHYRPAGIAAPGVGELLHQWTLFALLGVLIERFYALQAVIFGDGLDVWTLGRKIVLDQFGYTLFVALPLVVFWFALRQQGYRPLVTLRTLGLRGFVERLIPIFAGNLAFWVPALVCVYSLPQRLQFLLFLFLNAAWSLLMVFMARRQAGAG